MPWHVAKTDRCPASRPWAVVTDHSGEVRGCHETRAAAVRQMAVLYMKQNEGAIDSLRADDICPHLWPEVLAVIAANTGGMR